MGTHPIFESDFDCLTVLLYEVTRTDEIVKLIERDFVLRF